MPDPHQASYTIRCEWAEHGILSLAPASIVIIVDVLSFSTSVDVAVSRGVEVLPYRWKNESAQSYATEHQALLATRRGVGGEQDTDATGYCLSPASLLHAPAGLRLVLPSPNGSRLAFAAADSGATVLAGCLRNAKAVGQWAAQTAQSTQTQQPITVIPAGERWPDGSLRPALEDWLGAGALLNAIEQHNTPTKTPPRSFSPEAQAALAAFRHAQPHLTQHLTQCASGQELIHRQYPRDVELAAELNTSPTVPLLSHDRFLPAPPPSAKPIHPDSMTA